MKKVIRDFYSKKHDQYNEQPGFAFEDCFPGAEKNKPFFSGTGVVAMGMAACVAITVAVLLVYLGYTAGNPSVDFDTDRDVLVTTLHQGFQGSSVLGLSQAQITSLQEELERFLGLVDRDLPVDSDEVKVALLDRLLASRELNLSNRQAVAMTGLVGRWDPRMDAKAAGGDVWMDDAELGQFVADCSTHCHQNGAMDDYGGSKLRNYLLDCLDTRIVTKCSTGKRNGMMQGEVPGSSRPDALADVNI